MENVYMVYFKETGNFLKSGRNNTVATFRTRGTAQAQITGDRMGDKAVVVKVTGIDANE